MPPCPLRGEGGVPRRRLLQALALVPAAAAAGCAAGEAERKARDGAPGAAPARGGAPPFPDAAAAAIRGFAVPADADPAFVFRASAARPGDPR